MRALLKLLGYLLVLIVVIVVIAVIALPLYFDPNDYKDEIVAAVEKQTGRQLRIEGDIELSLFPWLGVKTGPVALGNAPGFGAEPFARVAGTDVSVKLLPLVKKRLETRTITVTDLTLNLAKDEQGKGNWEDLAGPPAQPVEPAEPAEGPGLEGVVIGGVRLENATLTWEDRQKGERYEVSGIDLGVSEITLDKPVDLSLKMDVASERPAVTGSLSMAATAHLDLEAQRYRLTGLEVTTDLAGEGLPGGKLDARLQAEADADLAAGTLDLQPIALDALGLKLTGKAHGEALTTAPRFTGELALAPFSPRELLGRLGQEPPETADPDALSRAEAALKLVAGSDSVDVTGIRVKLDESTLTGEAGVRRFDAPAIRFDLALDGIDVDAYLPPRPEGEPPTPATPAEGAAAGAGELPLETLRALDLDGSLRVGDLKVSGLVTRDVLVKVKAKDGLIEVSPINAQLYEGQYTGATTLDARGETLKSHVKWKLSGIQAGPLLKDLTGDDKLRGMGNVEADLRAAGADPDGFKRTLTGTASLSFVNGSVAGINIPNLLRKAKAKLEGKPPPPEEPARTDFTELSASLTARDGVITNQDLEAKSPLLRVEGEGRVDLPEDSLDYTVTTVVVSSLKGQGGEELEELKGVRIPIRLAGPLAKPAIKLDLQRLLSDKAKAELKAKAQEEVDKRKEEVIERAKEKLGDQVGDQLKDKLEGLFR